jgi:predicted GH43/DUF377 family glycosyl hydrolase
MNSIGGIKFHLKTQKRRSLVGIGAIVLSLLLIVGYATPAFANFNLVLDDGTSGEWDANGVENACVIQDGAEYKMWYSGYNGSHYQIGLATSSDGFMWTKHPGNPVLTAGSSGRFDEFHVRSPWVIKDGSTYKMWYSGSQAGAVYRIGYATSPDGISWIKVDGSETDQSVLDLGVGFDSLDVFHCSVIKNETDDYEMWYTGADLDNGQVLEIGHASSSDGISWIKTPGNPVLDFTNGGTWDDGDVYLPCVIKEATDDYRMWYTGDSIGIRRIGYANSTDGLTWTKNIGWVFNISDQSGAFDREGVRASCVIKDGTTYKMWYTGEDISSPAAGIGYATSNDGITWTRTQIPEFQAGSLGILAMLMLSMGIAIPVTMVLVKRRKRK